MKPIMLVHPDNGQLAARIAAFANFALGQVEVRHFPDGESYVRVLSDVSQRDVVLFCSLDRPDEKVVPLLLLAAAAREASAASVGLVAPYLAYMRQDVRFHPGETVSARHFARWLSDGFDWLVTVDPHLHRIPALSEVYSIPSVTVHAAGAIAKWLQANIQRPLLIGPDEESAQWVADLAEQASAPYVVLRKVRHGDRSVEVAVPDVDRWRSHTPVLVDDIVSTGRTMIETVKHLLRAGMAPPVCIGVHAIFAGEALSDLQRAGASRIVSCDTVHHSTNTITVVGELAEAIRASLASTCSPHASVPPE